MYDWRCDVIFPSNGDEKAMLGRDPFRFLTLFTYLLHPCLTDPSKVLILLRVNSQVLGVAGNANLLGVMDGSFAWGLLGVGLSLLGVASKFLGETAFSDYIILSCVALTYLN